MENRKTFKQGDVREVIKRPRRKSGAPTRLPGAEEKGALYLIRRKKEKYGHDQKILSLIVSVVVPGADAGGAAGSGGELCKRRL